MAKRAPKPPARWAYVLSGFFLAAGLAVVILPPLLRRPDVDDPNALFQAALRSSRRLTIVSGPRHVGGREGATLRTIEDPAEIRTILEKIVLAANPLGKGFRARELAKYKLVFDSIEVEFVMDEYLRAPFWSSDYRLTPESAKFLWQLLGKL